MIQAELAEIEPDTDFSEDNKLLCLNDHGGQRMDIEVEITPTLRASMANHPPLVPQPMLMASTKPNAEITEGISPTVTASAGLGGGNTPILFDNHARDCRYDGPLEVAPTITTTYGTGGGNIPLLSQPLAFSLDSKESNSMKSNNPNSGCRVTEQSRTIDTTNPDPSKNQGGIAIVQPQESFCIASNTINREDHNGGNGKGFQKDIAYTLTTSDIHAIYSPKPYQEIVGALMHRDHKGVNTCYVNQDKCIVAPQEVEHEPQVFGQSSFGGYDSDISTLTASGGNNGGGSENLAVSRNLVRRLTPLECERLQGFPDGWTNIEGASDSPRYKALGNSVAIPCVEYVMKGIANELNKQKARTKDEVL